MLAASTKWAFLLIPLSLLGFFCISFAQAEEMPAVTDPSINQAVYSEGVMAIPGLVWSGKGGKPDFTIETLKNGKPGARVGGRFESKNAGTLLFSSNVIQRAQYAPDDSGKFTVLIPLTSRKTPVKVQYIDDYGNKQSQDIEIVYENYYQFQLTQQTKKRWNFDGGASLSYLDYKQTAANATVNIAQIGLTPKFGVVYNLSEKLDLGASAFGTLVGLPMKSTPDGLSTPRFYGVNLRVGYKIYGLPTGNIYLMTGAYFWGMIGTSSTNSTIESFGVQKLSGPQLFLVGRFLTSEGRTAVGYLKAATILDGEGSMSSNREYAIGGAYQITPPKRIRRFMMNLDIASASFVVTGETIQLNSISWGISTPL